MSKLTDAPDVLLAIGFVSWLLGGAILLMLGAMGIGEETMVAPNMAKACLLLTLLGGLMHVGGAAWSHTRITNRAYTLLHKDYLSRCAATLGKPS